jgi:hypothetical protein
MTILEYTDPGRFPHTTQHGLSARSRSCLSAAGAMIRMMRS